MCQQSVVFIHQLQVFAAPLLTVESLEETLKHCTGEAFNMNLVSGDLEPGADGGECPGCPEE